MKKYPNLFKPLKIGNLTMRNRITMAPTSAYNLTPEGYLTQNEIAFFEEKAAGGAAIVTVGEGIVHAKTGQARFLIPLEDPGSLPSLARAARAIKRHGAIPSIELNDAGKHGGYYRSETGQISRVRYGPVHEIADNGDEILEMPEEMILEIVEAFGKGAAFVKTAGFEMVLVHSAHGWLLSQFLSPLENTRKDRFGGSLENRARFPLMVIDSVRKAVGPGFPIELRMNGSDFREGGWKLEEAIEFARMVDGKVDLIHISGGHHEVRELFVRTHPSLFLEQGLNVYMAEAIKKAVKTPVAVVGAITQPEFMEETIASGKADVVAMARALIADPYLPKKAAAGRTEEIRPCIRCSVCMGGLGPAGLGRCSVNPRAGDEYESKFAVPPPEKCKKVLIAGGGPGGMQAAITASARGHQVILCEKGSSLGGAIKYAEHVPLKEDLHRFRKHLEYMLKASGAVVMLNTEVTPELVAFQNPDALIVAVGATPIIPDIPGINSEKVVAANDLYNAGVKVGNKVVILGGGLVGCEEAVSMAREGKDVTVVEMLDEVARDSMGVHKIGLLIELDKSVKVVTNTKGKAITEEGLLCEGPDGKEVLYKADTIICAVGQKALTSVVEQLRDTAPEFYYIGDCVKPQKVTEAISDGYNTAMDL
jgi:2,4-dienoyl-CoA reductase-like NADH-dependent reductase (Old Yellow Enzyme family)/thioredoxin reductase